MDQDQYEQGQADLEKAVALDPAQADAQYLLGMFFLGVRDDPGKALPHLNKAADLTPDKGSVFAGRALVHERLGNPKKAKEDASRARALGATL